MILFPFLGLGAQEMPVVQSITVYNDTARLFYSYLYNQAGMKTLETEKELIGTQWKNVSQVEWIYDAGLSTQTFYEYAGSNRKRVYEIVTEYAGDLPVTIKETGNWESDTGTASKIMSREYDEEGRLLSERFYADAEESSEQISSQKEFVYDTRGLLNKFSVADGTGKVLYEVDCSYADDGKPLQQILRRRTGSELENHMQFKWIYDTAGRLVYMLNQEWQETSAGYDWVNVSNTAYDYDNDRLVSETYQYWNVECWIDNMRYVYEYDADGFMTERSLQMPLYDSWRTMSVIYYDNSSYPQKTEILSEFSFWGGDDGMQNTTWLPYVFSADNVESKIGYNMEITYNQRTATENIESGMTDLHVYPNPSDGIYYIDTGKYNIVSWHIFALDGSLVSACVNTNRTGVIDISARQPGVYMLRAESESGTFVTKLIKQ